MSKPENTKIKHLETKYALAYRDLICNCDGDELRFYLYLKLYAINKSCAWPRQETILRDLQGMTERKLRFLIKKMIRKGNLVYRSGVGRRSSEYDITKYDQINGQKVDNSKIGLQKCHLRGDKNVTSEVTKMSPELLYIELLFIEQCKFDKKILKKVDNLVYEMIRWTSNLSGIKQYNFKAWVRIVKKYGVQNTENALELSEGEGRSQYSDFWERLKASGGRKVFN